MYKTEGKIHGNERLSARRISAETRLCTAECDWLSLDESKQIDGNRRKKTKTQGTMHTYDCLANKANKVAQPTAK
jgi:hypothetical protein